MNLLAAPLARRKPGMTTFRYVSIRLEILFWNLAIDLLTESPVFQELATWAYYRGLPLWRRFCQRAFTPRARAWGLAATVALVLATAGAGLAALDPFQLARQAPEASLAVPTNGQRNLLVVGVDRLASPSPRLESVWLVVYFPGRSPVTLLPIYPALPGTLSQGEPALEEAFGMAPNGKPSAAFLRRLRQERLWWSGYLLLDEGGLAVLLDSLGGIELGGSRVDGARALASLPSPEVDRLGALDAQAELLRAACKAAGQESPLPATPQELARLLDAIRAHYRTDLDLPAILQEWILGAGEQTALACEFPLQAAAYP